MHQLRSLYVPILSTVLALGIALGATSALAQSGAGSIQGTVTDSTGAVIQAAAVHVVNVATGVVTDSKSNGVGFYQVPGLFTGHYRITFTASGMKTYITAIHLLAAQSAVINPVLTAGAVAQKVVVRGDAVQLLDTADGARTSILDNARINQLPMNGRDLTTLAADVVPDLGYQGAAKNNQNIGNHLINLPVDAMEYDIDGTPTTDVLNGGVSESSKQLIDPDAVQQVSIQVVGAGAQYASPNTGVITTKSGTNELHGSFFETARNNAWGIAKSRQDPSNFAAPEYIRNEFGVSVGGPIILPHLYHGKDKSFWFFEYERYSLAQGESTITRVPTDAMRQGNYDGLVNGAGIPQVVYDPATTTNSARCAATGKANAYCRTPFNNNQIPAGEESPTAKIIYQMTPEPTSADNPLVTQNWNGSTPGLVLVPQFTVRLDHVFNQNNRAYLRYTQVYNGTSNSGGPPSVAVSNSGLAGAANIPTGAAKGVVDNALWNNTASIGYTHVFSSTFFSETVASQQWFNIMHSNGVALNTNWENIMGLPNNTGNVAFPKLGQGILFPMKGTQTSYQSIHIFTNIDENLTKIMGYHQLQFGGRFRHLRDMDMPTRLMDEIDTDTLPTAVYNPITGPNYKALPNTGLADASFFLGSNAAYSVNLNPPHVHYHTMEFDAYVQDNYHINKNLTVNLGLRYEAHPSPWVKYGLLNSFDIKNHAVVLAVPPATLISEGYTTQAIITNDENIGMKFETPAEAGMPSTLIKNHYLVFLPRVGFAYQLFGGRSGTVIRGSFGRYTFTYNLKSWLNTPFSNNPLTGSWAQDYTSAAQAIDGLPNELLRYNDPVQFGVMGVNTTNVVNTSTTNSILPGVAINSFTPDWGPAYANETNVSIQQRLKGNSVLSVNWTWNHGTNLETTDNYNQHPSTYQWEMATGTVPPTGGTSVIGTPQQNTYAATATGPYDQTTYGANQMEQETGWSNGNELIVNYQRLYHKGIAYQISYLLAKNLSGGGNIAPDADYPGVMGTVATMTSPYGTLGFTGNAPPARPANLSPVSPWKALIKWGSYTGAVTHTIKFNGIVDLPVGRGKRFLGNANRFVNELVGGFQLAGSGLVNSQNISPSPSNNFGPVNTLHVYKRKMPITNCTSGVCHKQYLWYNGYIPPSQYINCTKNCITGIPSDYQPAFGPIDQTPGTTYYGQNEVQITAPNINNGKPTNIVYDAGPGAGSTVNFGRYIGGPWVYNADLSLFKVFPITERVRLRFNMDAFNAFNIQGDETPASIENGIIAYESGNGQTQSYWAPRQIQFTLRLNF